MNKFNTKYNEILESLGEKTYSLSEIEHLLNHKKVSKHIHDITNATSESNYMKALNIFSGITLHDVDIVDQLVGYSADKLHYQQRLDDNVKAYLDALNELVK